MRTTIEDIYSDSTETITAPSLEEYMEQVRRWAAQFELKAISLSQEEFDFLYRDWEEPR